MISAKFLIQRQYNIILFDKNDFHLSSDSRSAFDLAAQIALLLARLSSKVAGKTDWPITETHMQIIAIADHRGIIANHSQVEIHSASSRPIAYKADPHVRKSRSLFAT